MGWEGRGDRGEHVAGGCSPDPTWIGLLGGLMGGFAGRVGALSTPKTWGFSPPGAGSRVEEKKGAGGAPGLARVGKAAPRRELGSEQGLMLESSDLFFFGRVGAEGAGSVPRIAVRAEQGSGLFLFAQHLARCHARPAAACGRDTFPTGG